MVGAGRNGSVKPGDTLVRIAGDSQVFDAAPLAGYAVKEWWLDGKVAQVGGSNFMLSKIQDDHALTVTFTPPNDLVLTAIVEPSDGDDSDGFPMGDDLVYRITVANGGILDATGVVLTDLLPDGVDFVSAVSSQGTCDLNGRKVSCALGGLKRGELATMFITVIPNTKGLLMNTAIVRGNEAEIDLSNNQDTAVLLPTWSPSKDTVEWVCPASLYK